MHSRTFGLNFMSKLIYSYNLNNNNIFKNLYNAQNYFLLKIALTKYQANKIKRLII